jgi:beta-glucuronidase
LPGKTQHPRELGFSSLVLGKRLNILPLACVLAWSALLLGVAGSVPNASAAPLPTPGAPFAYGQSHRYTLGDGWYLMRDMSNVGLKKRWQQAKSFPGWEKISVPNAFNAGDDSELSYVGYVAWYATQFRRPAAPRGSNWILQFNSVNLRTRVFLNGRQIGAHNGGSVPFEIPASKLRPGTNTLILRVDSELGSTTVPSVEERTDQLTGGWWNFGGILREVVLRRVGRFDLSSVDTRSYVRTSKGKARGSARIVVLAKVKNHGRKARLKLRGRYGGVPIRFPKTTIGARRGTQIVGTVRVRRPRLWSPLAANLYRVQVDAPGVRWRSKAGIRKLSVSRKGIVSLNGLPLQLRGVSFHESDVKTGAAWSPLQREANNQLILRLGANVIRSHYPLAPQQMEWADARGVFVWVQAPVFRPRNSQLRSSRYRRTATAITGEIVDRYRGYPSVLTWSLSNEAIPSDTEPLDRLTKEQIKEVRARDPQGLLSADYASAPYDFKQQQAYRRLDILGINEYYGWYPGPLGETMSVAGLGSYLSYLHDIYPRQGLFITEFGAEANRDGPADEQGTYTYQANLFTAQMNVLRPISFLNGIFAWALRDYWVRPKWAGGNPAPTPPYSRKGLFQADNSPKPVVPLVEREFKATPPFRQ